MQIGIVGLGKMGGNMSSRLVEAGHHVVVTDLDAVARQAAADQGAVATDSLAALVDALAAPRAVWVMVPAGAATDSVLNKLADLLDADDVVVDGGNSNFKETMARADSLAERGIMLVDVGTSGGIWGLTEGYSMMVGGEKQAVDRLQPVLETLAPAANQGWGHVGRSGAGHYVKMVHNGIEYGIMQAYAEGFNLLRAKEIFDLDLEQVAEIWRFGSVIRSWLLDLIARALDNDDDLTEIAGYVPDSGEGRWTVIDGVEQGVPLPVISMALQMRFISRDNYEYWARLLAAMRNQFGGHATFAADDDENA